MSCSLHVTSARLYQQTIVYTAIKFVTWCPLDFMDFAFSYSNAVHIKLVIFCNTSSCFRRHAYYSYYCNPYKTHIGTHRYRCVVLGADVCSTYGTYIYFVFQKLTYSAYSVMFTTAFIRYAPMCRCVLYGPLLP